MTMLGTAIAIAAKAHENKSDKGGNAYILHPMRIMLRLRTTDEELMAMAILHDVIEDTDWTLEQLRHAGMSQRVVNALSCLTHPKTESYEAYIKRVSTNMDAIKIKLEDLRDNSDITRLKGLSQEDIERMEKYHKAYTYLINILKTANAVYGS